MARNSLKYELNVRCMSSDIGNKPELSDVTIQNYKAYNAHFRDYCVANGYNTFAKVEASKTAILDAYAAHLADEGKSPATIHSYLSAPCKALGVHLQDVDKPARHASSGKRADGVESVRSAREKVSPDYKDAYEAIKAIGCRESEAKRLTGDCMTMDKYGNLCVLIRGGKGGKDQLQRILPDKQGVVWSVFIGKEPGERVFTSRQFSKNINYHLARAHNAQDAYKYYCDTYKTPEQRAELSKMLCTEYRQALDSRIEAGKIKSKAYYAKQMEQFAQNAIEDKDKPYMLRGENRKLAEAKGLPVTYDRLALLATSVFHLSHWRLDVTVNNYMLK